MEIQGRSFPEFRHMFEGGYIKNIDRELVQELIDYIEEIDNDNPAPSQLEVWEVENERDEVQKEVDRYLQDISTLENENFMLKDQLRTLTSRIADLHEKSKELVDVRVKARS